MEELNRISDSQPVALRWFVKASVPGTIKGPTLQYAVKWVAADHSEAGVEWIDVPTVFESPAPPVVGGDDLNLCARCALGVDYFS